MGFEWDEQKRLLNLRKHRIDFADALTALGDDNALTMRDEDVAEEDRFVTLGSDLFFVHQTVKALRASYAALRPYG